MRDQSDLKGILGRLDELRSERDTSGKPSSLTVLLDLLEERVDQKERYVLLSTLAREYALVGMISDAEQTLQRQASEFRGDALPLISLAEHYLYVTSDYSKAAATIDRAIQRAQRTGHFLRQAYNTRARISRKLGDYVLLEDTILALIEYKPSTGAKDVRYEEDFLKGIPEGEVNPNVIETYRALVAASRAQPG